MESVLTELKDGSVDVTGGTMHYVEKGSGPALVLVHGYAPISTWRVWEANIDALAGTRRVIAVDLPGYGESDRSEGRPSDFGEWFSVYALNVHELISWLDIGPVALVGLSAGGGASLMLASQWPLDVERLILVDSAGSQTAERWGSIEAHTLLVWQKEDQIVPVEEGEKLAQAIPNSRLEILEGNAAGIDPHDWHWSQALNPDRFNEVVLDFVS